MTESVAASTQLPRLVKPETHGAAITPASVVLDFDEVYREHLAFVWRSARRLGVRDASLDDVVQDIFVIVHRRLADFEGRSALRTWLFAITIRTVRDQRRSVGQRSLGGAVEVDLDSVRATSPGPGESFEKAEAVQLLHALLDGMSDERREIFVMSELEQVPMPEIADVLRVNVNTAYARLRAARQQFEASIARHRARETWSLR